MRRSCLSFVVLVLLAGPLAAQEARLLRFPAVHGDTVVFSYAGNLYRVPSKGGVARRLTSDVGYEMFARFSPDGKQLAFTGQYDGNTENYLMPSEGGVPKRLTFTATLKRDDVSDRHAEWRQIFNESWRQMRDYFYVPNMNGVDWKAVRAKYEPLVPYVNHRADLTYVIGEMIIYEALINTVDKPVRLKLLTRDDVPIRAITVLPIADEGPLYYHQWVEDNIRKVSDATDGKVGYVHVPDMQARGLNQFAKYYYPQLRKRALIIDVRGNGGGNVSPMLIERLRREIAMIDISRDTIPHPDPLQIMMGPKVCLLNEYSASDGDLFPYRFRHYKLGKPVL